MNHKIYPIYQNGRVKVVPLISQVRVEIEGKPIGIYNIRDIESAIELADMVAEEDGVISHLAA